VIGRTTAYTTLNCCHFWLDLVGAYYHSVTGIVFLFLNYVLLLGMVDTVFADVAQPDQARIVAINAHHFLRNEGHVVISIKVLLALLNTVDVVVFGLACTFDEHNDCSSEKPGI